MSASTLLNLRPYDPHKPYSHSGIHFDSITHGPDEQESPYLPAHASRPLTTATQTAPMPRQLPSEPQSVPLSSMANSSVPSEEPSKKRRQRPDWKEFYKNGPPEEVIVIDDSPPPPQQQPARPLADSSSTYHVVKKRRTDADAGYDASYNRDDSVSETPGYDHRWDSGASGKNTTATTSLGSYQSHSDQPKTGSKRTLPQDDTVGQKRKRTRQSVADEALKTEAASAFPVVLYHPPPNPPIKARDVHVPVFHDPTYKKDVVIDDKDGHFIVVPGSNITHRYEIRKLLGQGTFGKVVEAWDRDKGAKCAIKVIRSVQKYRDASRIELRVLSTLRANDVQNRNKCIHLRDCFDFRNHICIVTDLLGSSVFDFLKANSFVPFPNSHIQSFARQLLTSIAFLHDLKLVHTDLKPENILLVRSDYQTFTYGRRIPASSTINVRTSRSRRVLFDTEIRLIDFGSATFDDEYHSSVVSTRHYRAPEIIFGLGWSFPCDIWSIGCILVEFFTGDALFQTHDNLEHLAMMEAVCDNRIDDKLVRQIMANNKRGADSPAKYFKTRKLDYPNANTTKASKKYVKAMRKLEEIIPANTPFNKQFLSLLRKIFVYDPAKRITALDALSHPWFLESQLDDGTEAARLDRQRQPDSVR